MGTKGKHTDPRTIHSEYWLRKQPLFIRLARLVWLAQLAWDSTCQETAQQRHLPEGTSGGEETFAEWLQRVLEGKISQEPLDGYDNPYDLIRTDPLTREQIEKVLQSSPKGIWTVMDTVNDPRFTNLKCELLADYLLSHLVTVTKKASDASRQREALVPFLFQTRAAAAGTTTPGLYRQGLTALLRLSSRLLELR